MINENLATPLARLGAHLLEIGLMLVTLGIGWIVWSLIIWGKGTTPAHQILKQAIVNDKTKEALSWGHMFVREFVIKGLLVGFLSTFTFGIFYIVDSLFVIKEDRKTLHDRICSSAVVQL